MDRGWIKLHRKILDCWIWDIKPFDKGRAWVDILLLTMHHDKKMILDDKPVVIERGTYFTSRGKLADRWGWSVKKVDNFLETLEKEKMIITERSKKGTTITVVNYEEYQVMEMPQDKVKDTAGKTAKIEKSEKAYYPDDEFLNKSFSEFVQMRNKIKKPLTNQAVKRAMNKLEKLSNGNNDLAVKILEQSIDHCWQDLYELKTDSDNRSCQKQSVTNDRDSQFWNLMNQIRSDEENDD